MIHLMRLVCVGYTPGPPENQTLPKVGQDDLFGALEAELGHADLIRNSLLMQLSIEVQYTSNYFLRMSLEEYIRIRSC